MRLRSAALAATLLIAGCGSGSPPDEATSRAQIEQTVLESQRSIAAGDGEAACELFTEETRERTAKAERTDGCEEAVAKQASIYAQGTGREMQANVVVDAIEVRGEQATATIHTSATLNGTLRTLPPSNLELHWEDGRWRLG